MILLIILLMILYIYEDEIQNVLLLLNLLILFVVFVILLNYHIEPICLTIIIFIILKLQIKIVNFIKIDFEKFDSMYENCLW